jgi:RNA polymerase sigma-70 factor (ECF subfamily)
MTVQPSDERFAEVWRAHRTVVLDVAYQLLGRFGDAEDAAQEAFARLARADLDAIDDVRAWLVVVTTRLCLDILRSARVTREELASEPPPARDVAAPDPADRITLDDSVRSALAVVLQQLTPAERVVFVLHDVFGYSFDTIATTVGRSPAACRQLASRARRRVRDDAGPDRSGVVPADAQRVTERFVAACAGGDLGALMELLDPDVVGDADLGPGIPHRPQHGREQVGPNVLRFFAGELGVTLLAHGLASRPSVLAFRGGELFAVASFVIEQDRIVDIHVIVEPEVFLRTMRAG